MLRYTIYALVFFSSIIHTFCASLLNIHDLETIDRVSNKLIFSAWQTQQDLLKKQTNIYGMQLIGCSTTYPLEIGDLILDGAAIPATENDGLSYDMAEASAIAVAAAINTSGTDANTRAVVNPTVTETTTYLSSGNVSGVMTINGIATNLISLPGTLYRNVENALVAINAISTETGVEASTDEIGNLRLTAPDGRNITVEYGTGISNTDLGAVEAGTITGTVKLTSSNPITVSGLNPDRAGFIAGKYLDIGLDNIATARASILQKQKSISDLRDKLETIEKLLNLVEKMHFS